MNDLCLKFESESEAQQMLAAAGLLHERDLVPGVCIDVIGTIRLPVGEPDADGNQPTEQLPGWHVNVLCASVPEALQPYIVTPARRVRVWA